MELLAIINGEVRVWIEENVRNLSINEIKVFFFLRFSEFYDIKLKKK